MARKSIYDYLPTFNFFEPNNLKGLQPGFVVAQAEVVGGSTLFETINNQATTFVANGRLAAITANGFNTATANDKVLFITYSEPLNRIRDNDKYYATDTELENVRFVQLIPGDEWTIEASANHALPTEYTALITAGRIAEIDAESTYSKDNWFKTVTDPEGNAVKHFVFLG